MRPLTAKPPMESIYCLPDVIGLLLCGFCASIDPDFYDYMKLINFVRSRVKEGAKGPEVLAQVLADEGVAFRSGEKYAIPVREDDAVLFRFEQGLKELSGLVIRDSGKEVQVAMDVSFLLRVLTPC